LETKAEFQFFIDRKLCKKCGICISFCPAEVYTADDDDAPQITYPEKCIFCNLCFYRCPDFAIKLEVAP